MPATFLVGKKLQKTKLALALSGLFLLGAQTPLVFAADTSQNLNQSSEEAYSWPMLPGESVNSLAKLFYPKNEQMRRLFVTRTLQLSHDIAPNLDAESSSNQVRLIIVPDIKTLAKQSGSIKSAQSPKAKNQGWKLELRLSYGLKDAADFVVSKELQASYDDLVKRNEFLKLELEKLNQKLDGLQKLLVRMKEEAIRLLSLPAAPAVVLESKPKPIRKAGEQAQPVMEKVKPTVPNSTPESSPESTVFGSGYSWLLLPIILLVLAIFYGINLYTRRREKDLYLASAGSFDPLGSGIFSQSDLTGIQGASIQKVDFALTQSEFSGNMSVVDLSDVDVEFKEESELVLEQARIYVNIGRTQEAIELLKAQIKTMPKASAHHCLYLLDIYRDTNQKEEFLLYAKQLNQNFNVMMPMWENAPLPMVVASTLEEFAHIVEKLTKLWAENLTEAEAYVEELLTDNRDNERAGFGMEVFQELVLLRDILKVRSKLSASEPSA